MAAILQFPTKPRDFASGYIQGLDDGAKLAGDQKFLTGLAIGILATVLVGLIVFAAAR